MANQFLTSGPQEQGTTISKKGTSKMSRMVYPKGPENPECWAIIESDEQEELLQKGDVATWISVRKSPEANEYFQAYQAKMAEKSSEKKAPKPKFTPK